MMRIVPLRALKDNYIWLMIHDGTAVVVDPGEAMLVLDYLSSHSLDLTHILLTHNHEDHTGGVNEIFAKYPQVEVLGPVETDEFNTRTLRQGDTLEICNQPGYVMHTPGHTMEHISYLLGQHLFCGDALFSAGCGRVFTGDYEAAYRSMQWFKQLSNDVHIYAGHEYTITNLLFNQSIFPNNPVLERELKQACKYEKENIPSYPSSIQHERTINLLMMAPTLDRFIQLRKQRDQF